MVQFAPRTALDNLKEISIPEDGNGILIGSANVSGSMGLADISNHPIILAAICKPVEELNMVDVLVGIIALHPA